MLKNGWSEHYYEPSITSQPYLYPVTVTPSDLLGIRNSYPVTPTPSDILALCKRTANTGENAMKKEETNHYCFPVIEKIIVNDGAVIVFYDDLSKSVVKRAEFDDDDIYAAVAQAYCKKAFGSTSAFHNIVDRAAVYKEKKKAKEASCTIPDPINEVIKKIKENFKKF